MTITYIGLSCFILENAAGYRVVVDPFNDAPELSLGIRFPDALHGAPFGANLVLMSEPDADHARAPGPWLQDAPRKTAPGSTPFPGLDLRGTIIHEWNGDLNIAYHYTLDGLRIAHFADNAHLLTDAQLAELGTPDIVTYPGPKPAPESPEGISALETVRANLRALRPKLILWSHQIVPQDLPAVLDASLRPYFVDFFARHASTSQYYRGSESFIQLCHVLENAAILNAELGGEVRTNPVLEVSLGTRDHPKSVLFRGMVAEPT